MSDTINMDIHDVNMVEVGDVKQHSHNDDCREFNTKTITIYTGNSKLELTLYSSDIDSLKVYDLGET